MKNLGNKSVKPGARRKKGATDVSPSTSLPPLVEGQLHCFLRVTVSKILWTVPKPPSPVLIRLRWWGETSDGTIFRPRISSQAEQKGVRTTTRYAIRCGPKQLTSYLTDMGSLVLEAMTKLDHLPIGRVQINGLPRLSSSHPISGFFTIISPTSEKLGELQVSAALEPLSETYDSSSSFPNTDISLDTDLRSKEELGYPVTHIDPSQPNKLPLPSTGRRDSESSRASTPRGRDHLYFQENTDPNKKPIKESQERIPPKKKTTSFRNEQERPLTEYDAPRPAAATKDLISALLNQGNKLRDSMVVSALTSHPSVDLEEDIGLSPALTKEIYSSTGTRSVNLPPAPRFLQNLLKTEDKGPSSKETLLQRGWSAEPEIEAPSETKAIELLLGSSVLSPGYYWDGTGSPPESILGSDFYNESELNDPHYDQSLLENLFYTAPKSDSSDFISDQEDPKESRRKKSKKNLAKDGADQSVNEEQNVLLGDSGMPWCKGSVQCDVVDLTVDRLALLGRMHIARVVVDTLKVHPEDKVVTPSKRNSKGKPPRPTSSVKRTFFVEFHFPVSTKNKADVAVATEITRLVSSKIVSGSVKFQQRFVFPILFSGQMIEHWWNSHLVFRVFLRKGSQKKPGLVGSASLPLRDVLFSQNLSVTGGLHVHCTEPQQETTDVGPLQVSVELAGENRDLVVAPLRATESAKQALPQPVNHSVAFAEPQTATLAAEPPSQSQAAAQIPPAKHEAPRPTVREDARVPVAEDSALLLHVVLLVPEGKGFVCAACDSSSACNSYLNCKLFSSLEATRSAVVWGTTQPVYNFSQVAPISLTSHLLERLKNNMMIIEVWNKTPGVGRDQLMGLAKLPLHQFYMSFRDPKISRLLLQAQYPVVAVDSLVPVTDVFSGIVRGKLRVLLAMGSGDQVMALQRLKHKEEESPALIPRPAHFLDPPQPTSQDLHPQEGVIDHVFEIHVEDVKGLTPLQSTVWGEADCFVQYYFPVLPSSTGSGAPETDINLKPVRTATTLCVPDPVFNDRQSHSLAAPSETPVQRLLLGAYSKQGLSGGGGVTFEIWCRYYYPNVRDQLVAKGVLPLSRLCAMVTMQHREDVGIQAFSLPLIPRSESPGNRHLHSSGLLNVNVTYRRSLRNASGMLATRMVSISVQIHRASGLQAAARVIAEQDPSFEYNAEVGVNAFVTVHPSFLPEAERRTTRTVARSFAPEFDHHSEFPCNLVIQRSNGEASSLAEIISFSDILFSVYHQSVQSDVSPGAPPARDYPLGVVRISAKELITKRSGVSGWYPVTVAEVSKLHGAPSILQSIVGGLELSVSFAHHADRERVLEVARGLGWAEDEKDGHETAARGEDEWQTKEDLVNLSVTIPKIWLPVHCLLLAGQTTIHRSTYCYLRYKLYDKEAYCTPLKRPKLSEDGQQATVMFEQTQSTELLKHQPLVWYLREERLEIQVWRSYGRNVSGLRPQDTDRLLGCAYVELNALSVETARTLSISGVYPLFKRNVSNLWGAALRVHLALSSAYHPSMSAGRPSDAQEISHSEEEEAGDEVSRVHSVQKPDHLAKTLRTMTAPQSPPRSTDSRPVEVAAESSFAVNIVIERAMHLSLKGSPLTKRLVSTPSCCVSFPVAGDASPVTTPVIEDTDSPMWNFQHQTRLTNELLSDPQQALVFKVWHKADVERVLGFASVDLSPLLSGFQSVCGWYNIGDFTGDCQGQIKVSITPLESIAHLKEERRAASRSFLFQPNPAFCGSFSSYNLSNAEVPAANVPMADDWKPPPLRHEEHLNNVRRFHQSLQQTERHTHSAEPLDLLTQSSRTSLLSSLRKNLGELDDIQKYFNQKLYRSLSNADTQESLSQQSRGIQDIPPTSAPDQNDPDTQLLLKKSSLLVSQVSNLITGLQHLPKSTPATSSLPDESLNTQCQDGRDAPNLHYYQDVSSTGHKQSRQSEPLSPEATPAILPDESLNTQPQDGRDAPNLHYYQDEGVRTTGQEQQRLSEPRTVASPPLSPTASPAPGHDVLDLFRRDEVREEDLSLLGEFDRAEEADNQSVSDEDDYEEDVIEPRMLNEVTAMTDRTSPWSSILSDPESGHHPVNGPSEDQEPGVLSSEDQREEDELSSPFYPTEESGGSETSDKYLRHFIRPDNMAAGMDEAHKESSEELERTLVHEIAGPVLRTDSSDSSSGRSDSEKTQSVGMSCTMRSDPALSTDNSRSNHPPESTQRSHSPSDESATELPDFPSTDLLSKPVLVPNFFLPPQHLEASMRLLSVSQKDESETQNPKGFAFRRRPRQKISPADLPEEETRRIAKIFASRFSKPQ
ncbi:C2 domain-containing protein 3 [Pelodytes ibericus]